MNRFTIKTKLLAIWNIINIKEFSEDLTLEEVINLGLKNNEKNRRYIKKD